MAAKTDICNTALARIGQDPITALTENTDAAKRCNILFDEVSDLVMASGEWTTLIAQQQLAKLTVNPIHDFDFQYQLPTDLIKLIAINNNDPHDTPYRREGDKLLVNFGTLAITYIKREANTQLWGPHLTTAVSLKLASELALPLTNSSQIVQMMEEKYARWLRTALASDNQQSSTSQVSSEDLLRVR